MFLDNIKLYLADQQTGRLEMRFICHHCGKEITEEPRCQLRLPRPGSGGKYELMFWCNEECQNSDK